VSTESHTTFRRKVSQSPLYTASVLAKGPKRVDVSLSNLKKETYTVSETACLLFLHLVFLRSVYRLLAAACVVPSSSNFVTLMKEALGSSET
jgi:hypothetical protein